MREFDISKSWKEYEGLFLTEEKVGNYLKLIFPNNIFIRNKKFLNHSIRPDYVCHELKLVVEYEGDVSNESNWYTDANGTRKLYATGVDYGAVTPMLVQAIKAQQNIILSINHCQLFMVFNLK